MTTYEGVPSLGTFLSMKLANRISKARANNATNRARTIAQTIVQLMMHLSGFTLLTLAAFSWNMTAGLIVAGFSCFVFSWLMNGTSTETPTPDPFITRR